MRALIYCRVSTKEQAKNLSLPAQRKACSEYCRRQNWKVAKVFVERGESAKSIDRTQLTRLIDHCRRNRGQIDVLVVYSLDRFARNNYDHYTIRALLASFGISLRSVTQPIDDSPTGKLMEGMLAAIAQFDNDQRAEKTSLGMKEAMKRGRWPFPAPLGYVNLRRPDGTETLEHDSERAPLIRKAFELYATGLYTKNEVLEQINLQGLTTVRGNRLTPQSFGKMLTHPLYMARVRNDEWGIDVEGDFEPIVDEHTFYRVQAVLRESATAGTRKSRNHPDFPLRRFVRCAECSAPLTASWSRSHTGRRYAYYHCPGCKQIRTRKEALEELFLGLLDRLRPRQEYLAALRETVLEVWHERREAVERAAPVLRKRLEKLEQQKQRLVQAYVYDQALDEGTYRSEMARLRGEIVVARVERNQNELDELDVEGVLEFAEYVVLNAGRMWSEFSLEQRRKMQKVLFPEGLIYDGAAFRTPATCLFFRDLEASQSADDEVVALKCSSSNTLVGWVRQIEVLDGFEERL